MSTTDLEVMPDAELMAPSAIEALTRGEIDIQVATARRYPRQLRTFEKRVLDMATLNQETAESCLYAVPRDGKTIEGPSVRFAELITSVWGNVRVEGRMVADDGKLVTGRGTCLDLETNVAVAVEVQRRVTDKKGKRYKDDMIVVTGNAAIAIATRNAVLKVIPKVYWQPAFLAARKVAVGDASTLVNRRAQMLTYFLKLGASNDKVFGVLNVQSAEEITLDHLAVLKGLATAIKDGDTTVDNVFNPAPDPKVQRASASVNENAAQQHDAKVLGKVFKVEQADGGRFWLTLMGGERLFVEREDDAAELLKFEGTDHLLQLSCAVAPGGESLVLRSFVVAD